MNVTQHADDLSDTKYVIYQHYCNPTGKSYIGQTCNLHYRTWRHQRSDSGCVAFRNAIKKYGWQSFSTIILADELTLAEANHLEEQYIKDLHTESPGGYNLTPGGNNKSLSEATKQKISKLRTGVPRTEETKEKIRQFQLGKINSPATREKIRQAKLGKPRSEETKQKIRDTYARKKSTSR